MVLKRHNESIRNFLATEVMKWKRADFATTGKDSFNPWRIADWIAPDGARFRMSWNPVEEWSDIGIVLDAVKTDTQGSKAVAALLRGRVFNESVWSILSPYVLSEIVATAYGWKEETPLPAPTEVQRECWKKSLDYGSYGYPCTREKGHEGPHECLDKDDCPHHF